VHLNKEISYIFSSNLLCMLMTLLWEAHSQSRWGAFVGYIPGRRIPFRHPVGP
jgi:hypothetical protein